MRRRRILNAKVILLILLISVFVGFIGSVLIKGVERIIYPMEYREIVTKYSEKYAVPAELVFAVIKAESGFDKNAVSHRGAIGLMQLLPKTAEWLATSHLGEISGEVLLYDPEVNVRYGVYYLQYLFSRFGSWEKAIIAYNWGEGNFRSFIDEDGYTEGDYKSIPVRETRNYVKKVMNYWEKYKNIYK